MLLRTLGGLLCSLLTLLTGVLLPQLSLCLFFVCPPGDHSSILHFFLLCLFFSPSPRDHSSILHFLLMFHPCSFDMCHPGSVSNLDGDVTC